MDTLNSAVCHKPGEGEAPGLVSAAERALQLKTERLALLTEAAEHLLSTDDPQQMIEGLFEKVAAHLELDTYFNFMVTEDGKRLRLDFCAGVPEEFRRDIQFIEFGDAICGTVAQIRRRIVAEHILTSGYDKAALVRSFGIRCYCCHPLMIGERLIGTLSFASHTRDTFDPEEVELLRSLCHYVEMAKERVRLYQSVRRELEERKRVEAEILALNARLQRAMTETHHRVKNNLQVIVAMIDMQMMEYWGSDGIPVKEFTRLKAHVRTLAIVHDLLTKGIKEDESAQRLSARLVLEKLLPMLQETAWNQEVRYSVTDAELTAKQCIALALVLNELVTNALKHARSRAEALFTVDGVHACLIVLDDGPGFAEDFDPDQNANTGLELVKSLVKNDLLGQTSYQNSPEGGASVTVTFPLPDPVESEE